MSSGFDNVIDGQFESPEGPWEELGLDRSLFTDTSSTMYYARAEVLNRLGQAVDSENFSSETHRMRRYVPTLLETYVAVLEETETDLDTGWLTYQQARELVVLTNAATLHLLKQGYDLQRSG